MKVEIGGGMYPAHPDWEQFDAIDWSEQTGLRYTLGDARALPYATGSLEHVYAQSLLEHFPPADTLPVLLEWSRVLSVGGKLELVAPDAMGILRDYFSGAKGWAITEERLLGTRDYPGNEHLTCFTLAEFPAVIAAVPSLELVYANSSHAGGGIHALASKTQP
jgi:predicted SAM-dependent methyltransferase